MSPKCLICNKEKQNISTELGICLSCIRNHPQQTRAHVEKTHRSVREELKLPLSAPKDRGGILCDICINGCIIGKGSTGYCGIRKNENGRLVDFGGATLDWHFEDLHTNFISSKQERTLTVFYGACSFNCLFCQSWHFRDHLIRPNVVTAAELISHVDPRTKAIYFYGGDPTPQLNHAIDAAKMVISNDHKSGIRINFETNGSMNEGLLLEMAELTFQSGGAIKYDLKAFDDNLHLALTGKSNEWTLRNFELLVRYAKERGCPELVVASTPMIPGYIDIAEISAIAKFIAKNGPYIPYILLGFYPQFYMYDLMPTSWKFAEEAKLAAKEAGLNTVHIGNQHLLK